MSYLLNLTYVEQMHTTGLGRTDTDNPTEKKISYFTVLMFYPEVEAGRAACKLAERCLI